MRSHPPLMKAKTAIAEAKRTKMLYRGDDCIGHEHAPQRILRLAEALELIIEHIEVGPADGKICVTVRK